MNFEELTVTKAIDWLEKNKFSNRRQADDFYSKFISKNGLDTVYYNSTNPDADKVMSKYYARRQEICGSI